MLKRIIMIIFLSSKIIFAMNANDVQNASGSELGCIKGLGHKRINFIIDYRSKNPIKDINDLLNIRGIGKVIFNNIKNDIKKKICTKDKKDTTTQQNNTKKRIKAE